MGENHTDLKSDTAPSVLITGGGGLVGRYLTSLLQTEGFRVSHLSRHAKETGNVRVFSWDPAKGYIDNEAFEGLDYLVHLAGTNIGEKRWSVSRKKEIRASRSDSANLLFRAVSNNKIRLKAFITASAVGYYGSQTSEKIFTEDDPSPDDFLAATCRLWEDSAGQFETSGIRTVKIRTGVVLESNEGALARLMQPAKAGLVVRLGTGNQYFPWIHIEDLCRIYLKAICDQELTGAYNAVAPEYITHNDFVRSMAKVIGRPVFLPPVPEWVLRALMGEMADIILQGSRVSAGKIIASGYRFRFVKAEDALKNLIGR